MYSLTIAFGPGPTVWRFLFKSKESAEKYRHTELPMQDLHIEDDYGQIGDIKAPSIHGRMMENLDESKFAYIEMGLHNERVKIMANERGRADPTIRNAMRQGPAVLTPMGGNGMG